MSDPSEAARRLTAGGVVGLPTETVYGLAARADDADAVTRIFEIKGRPADHPLIVHFATPDPLGWARDGWIVLDASPGSHTVGASPHAGSSTVVELATRLWPGPLTLILRAGPRLPRVVTGGRDTVGVRVPDHPLALAALVHLGVPVAAPSANPYGRVSPTAAAHVISDLAASLHPPHDGVLDGGETSIGVESTIIDLTCSPPQVLRAGGASLDIVEQLVGPLSRSSGPARASGMHAAHYAPNGRVELAGTPSEAHRIASGLRSAGQRVEIIDRSADPVGAAKHLYTDLRRANGDVDTLVFVLPTPSSADDPLVAAVRDRLERAATGTRSNPTR